MRIKDFRAEVKAAGDGLAAGEFTALVSVFGNEDSVGDVVMPGAFTATLGGWVAKGDPIPVIWSHDWADPFSHIGHVLAAEETDRGLVVKGVLDLDNPTAVQVHRLMLARRVTNFSFAYDVVTGGWETEGGKEFYALHELDLFEVGPCLIGANRETELIAAKAAVVASAIDAGRSLPAEALADLKAARDAIDGVLAVTKTPDASASGQTPEPSQADGPPADEEPEGAKSDQAVPPTPRRALAVATITTL